MSVPKIFRVIVPVNDIELGRSFYGRLLGIEGRPVGGGRCYFQCGEVILALLEDTEDMMPMPDDLYFAVADLEEFHRRAHELGVLSNEDVHGESAADIVTRPWGERSFYAEDPFGNPLCFVDEATLFTGSEHN
jgi:extradiol dioxygenase family protein